MFTGIIKTVAKVKKAEFTGGSLFLTVEKPKPWKIKPGDSIATDGACLTVKKVGSGDFTVELMPETLSKTVFGKKSPHRVNLEQSLKLTDLLDGHLVMGHVDTVGKISQVERRGASKVYTMQFPRQFSKLIVSKGAIAVDGISLTIVDAGKGWFTVSLVDHTIKNTTLGEKSPGEMVNIEFDILAKYLNRIWRKQ
ncbi:MAG: riboflavin synthase [Candidatus Doudnabacteria bacterium]|nr:riboflavin synthase [Candidatus Doudnabacteria bacterium]